MAPPSTVRWSAWERVRVSGWENFFVAQVRASAALAGLLFVSVPVNLTRILALPGLPARSGMTLIVLCQLLLASTCMLVSGQPVVLVGAETLIIGMVTWLGVCVLESRTPRAQEPNAGRDVWLRRVLGQAATLPFVIAGAVLIASEVDGLSWTVPGVLFSFVYVFIQAWVLLVEINR